MASRVIHLLPTSRSERTYDGKPAAGAIKADTAAICIRHGLRVCVHCAEDYRKGAFGVGLIRFSASPTTP